MAAAPSLRILATSRSVLNLSGEHIFSVLPLPLPDLARLPPPDDLAAQPAVALLLDRTRAHTPGLCPAALATLVALFCATIIFIIIIID